MFDINEGNGELRTSGVGLDYERQREYILIISTREANGQTDPQYSATVSVEVLVRGVVFLCRTFLI